MTTHTTPPRIIVICGPTGTGKTAAAITTAQAIGAEIVSADSMQIYRYMDIGTAKPSLEEQSLIRHYLIDIVDPDEAFDARKYAVMAGDAIQSIMSRNRTVLVVGGAGLYIRALLHGLFTLENGDDMVRDRLKQKASLEGLDCLYAELKQCDPESANRIHPNDTYRIIRALEIFETTGTPMSKLHQRHGFSTEIFAAGMIGLYRQKELLYERIDNRVDQMLQAGFIQEVQSLLDRGYSSTLKSMKSLGYRHMADHLEGRMPLSEAVPAMKRDTRRYAKRQMTWFRSEKNIQWIDAADTDAVKKAAEDYLAMNADT
ncbi:MAG: tRNA (adenosine(37)-N6)-dimethylallyltransferase MiaA [Desulfatirhabdiaceae bacterium]